MSIRVTSSTFQSVTRPKVPTALLLAYLFICPQVQATSFTGPVVSVLDGDGIEVLHSQHPERIRLSGIDCPEKGQVYGKRAKQAASELALERN